MDARDYIAQGLKTKELIDALYRVDRRDYLPEKLKDYAYKLEYADSPLKVTDSGITTTAFSLGLTMLDLLELKKGDKVLEIGTGTGYYTALIAEVVGDSNIVSIEIDEEMYNFARERLLKKYSNLLLIKGDGSIGYKDKQPYNKAIAWAAFPTIPCLVYDQLSEGGILITPIEDHKGKQGLYKIIKASQGPVITKLFEVIFMRAKGLCGFIEDQYSRPQSSIL